MSDRKRLLPIVLAAALAALTGCASMAPALPEARPDIPASWPLPESGSSTSAGDGVQLPVADIGWRDFFADARLAEVIALALEHNRDLRVAALNVERVQAQYRIQRSQRLPSLGAELVLERRGGDAPVTEVYQAGVGVAAFELDLFGRVRSLSQAALERYLASDEARRATQISLVAQVAGTWLALAADQELLRLSEAVLDAYTQTLELGERRYEVGATSALELEQIRTQVATARADAARQRGQVAQGRHALDLLVGVPVPASLLPDDRVEAVTGIAGFSETGNGDGYAVLGSVPAGLDSQLLLRRPDVLAAEYRLRAANADIGAARAAFFPSISLTGTAGSISEEFSGLFDSGTRFWAFIPRLDIPIFQGGRLRAALGVAQADRDIALAQYEQAIQAGFRDVADALAAGQSLAAQLQARQDLVAAASRAEALAQARHDAGLDSYLVLLDVQRTLYAAQQALVATRMAEQANRVTLYRALGGGWREESAATPVPATDPQGS